MIGKNMFFLLSHEASWLNFFVQKKGKTVMEFVNTF